MEKLICEQCGTHNKGDDKVCHLCGDPLDEEREEEHKRQTSILIVQAVALTLVVLGVPGYFLEMYVSFRYGGAGYHPVVFWFVYLAVWAIILMLAGRVRADDRYVRYGPPDRRGLNHQQERMLWSMIIFLPAVMVREFWVEVFKALKRQ